MHLTATRTQLSSTGMSLAVTFVNGNVMHSSDFKFSVSLELAFEIIEK
jgi:hypothetical protein